MQESAIRIHLSPSKMSRTTLWSPDLRALWLVTVINQLGGGILQVTLGWLIFALTDSSAMVGVVFALRSAPNLIVGFVAGALTDRFDRRRLMRLSVFGMALASLVMAWLHATDRLDVWHVLVYASVLGTLFSCEATARQTYVYDLTGAQSALRGLALNSLAQRLGGAVGALVAGATLQWWGIGETFLIVGLCYGIGGCAVSALRHQGVAVPISREPLWQNLRTYVQALRSHRVMQSLIISTAAAEILGFSHQVLLPVIADNVLNVGAAGLGVLTTFRFVGGMLGVALLTIFGSMQRQGRLLLIVLVLFGLGQVLLGQVTAFWLAVICVTGINVMATATDILHTALLQLHVSNEQRGRAMGSWVVGTGTAPLGHLEIGYLAGLTSTSLALVSHGMALVALPLVLLRVLPELRRL
jgi:MFS family permease